MNQKETQHPRRIIPKIKTQQRKKVEKIGNLRKEESRVKSNLSKRKKGKNTEAKTPLLALRTQIFAQKSQWMFQFWV